jgi:flagellar assembly factor FliW
VTVRSALSDRPATLPDRLTFANPIPGFEAEREFDVAALGEDGVLHELRSRRTEGLRFVVAAPGRFFPDYKPVLLPADVSALGLGDGEQVLLQVIVTVGESIRDATANLLAPIAIAASSGAAVQLVLPDTDLPLRAPLLARAS